MDLAERDSNDTSKQNSKASDSTWAATPSIKEDLFSLLPNPSQPTTVVNKPNPSQADTSTATVNKDSDSEGPLAKRLKTEEGIPAANLSSTPAPSDKTGAQVSLETACSEDKGRRNEMEDAWVINPDARENRQGATRCSFCAVFDGHGGRKAADAAARTLHANVLEAGLLKHQTGELSSVASVSAAKKAILEGFKRTDQGLLAESAAGNWQDGATAVCMWVCGDMVHMANLGDAKAVLARANATADGTQGGKESLRAITLTKEHKAIYAPERARIEKAGGHVTDGRLLGRVEVSRSFGDRAFKKVGMSAVPDLRAFQLGHSDRFILMGCDGFWGVFGPQDAVDFVAKYQDGRSVKAICNRILNEAIRERKCKDNCTVMLTVFSRTN